MTNNYAWRRYWNDPEALVGIIIENNKSIERDPANAEWYREQNQAIRAYLGVDKAVTPR